MSTVRSIRCSSSGYSPPSASIFSTISSDSGSSSMKRARSTHFVGCPSFATAPLSPSIVKPTCPSHVHAAARSTVTVQPFSSQIACLKSAAGSNP